MQSFIPFAAFALIAMLQATLSTESQRPLGAFRSAVDLVPLNVTVLTASHEYVGDLDADDFVILENGVPQQVRYFATTSVPLAVALLLDSSASMEKALASAQDAAVGFTRTIQSDDFVSIIDFDSRIEIAQAFTADQAALERGIRTITAGGATAIYNAVYIALAELRKVTKPAAQTDLRRRAIVLLSDGDDTASLVTFEEVLDAALRSDTVIYTIGLGVNENTATRSRGEHRGAFLLRRLAEQTGGRAFFPSQPKDLTTVYATIRQDLAQQYSLAYESSNRERDGAWRHIGVRVNRPSVVVRTRQGYFAPTR